MMTRVTFKLGWHTAEHNNKISGRIHHLIIGHNRRWYDWGSRAMILVGDCVGGSYNAPEPATWWYRQGPPTHMRRTRYPQHPLSTYQVVTDYTEFRRLTSGLNEDEMYEWQAFYVDQDGQLTLGHRYWGGAFYGMTKADVALLRRYLRHWRRHDWWGLRSWIYAQALHSTVHERKPFACHAVPSPGSGGYSHWHCDRRKHHDGMHKSKSYRWADEGRVIHMDSRWCSSCGETVRLGHCCQVRTTKEPQS